MRERQKEGGVGEKKGVRERQKGGRSEGETEGREE